MSIRVILIVQEYESNKYQIKHQNNVVYVKYNYYRTSKEFWERKFAYWEI